MSEREYQSGDIVKVLYDNIPNLTVGKEYRVVSRTYVGGHADCYVLNIAGNDGRIVTQEEGSFKLIKAAEGSASE
ncbi:MAG TPA: hypothetical protein VI968_04185 [archaeon]|nr:hypothetical protein [archaeon]